MLLKRSIMHMRGGGQRPFAAFITSFVVLHAGVSESHLLYFPRVNQHCNIASVYVHLLFVAELLIKHRHTRHICMRSRVLIIVEVLHVVTLTHSSVALVYVCAATGFGVGALYFERPIIIAVSATAGSFLFCAGAKQWRGRQLEKLSRADDTTFEKLVE
eukprot:m.145094 g.145094  ORF g.145094 m.145094 type:complete len:159 (+) comp14137_c0_seq8:791-1267(+)